MSISEKISRLSEASHDIAESIMEMGGSVGQSDGFEEYADDILSIPSDTGGFPYVQFTAEEDNSELSLAIAQTGIIGDYKYKISTDGLTWQDYIEGSTILLAHSGDWVRIVGVDNWRFDLPFATVQNYQFQMSGKLKVSGDLFALYSTRTLSGFYAFENYFWRSLFKDCTALTDASDLVICDGFITPYCFDSMFYGCTSLVYPPKLLLTTMTDHCYHDMFYGCTSLVSAPDLPATALATNCYEEMFYGCTSLINAPERLPATTLATYCYNAMFYGCTSLATAPELPATTLATYCYNAMFYGCTSLATAPELPATTIARGCYAAMFQNCWAIDVAPELPATEMAYGCYLGMFSGCESLFVAPELPATTLAERCYMQMFKDCTSLMFAPELPAIDTEQYCYYAMFRGCINLIDGAVMHFQHAWGYTCDYMYYDCVSLSSIKLYWEGDVASDFINWVKNVPLVGTFYYNGSDTTRGDSRIPTGWTITKFDTDGES